MKRFSDSELNELEYPDVTFGSIAAREIREECNKLTMQEREELFREGLALIRGGDGAIEAKSLRLKYMNATESFTSISEEQKQSIGFWEEMAIIEFTESVLEQLELQNMSKADLAKEMNVSPAYITRLLGGSSNLTLRTMVRVARALGCEFGCHLQPNS